MTTPMISASLRARIQYCIDRYAFDPSQKRDDLGQWTKESGAMHNANEFNKILAPLGADPVSVIKTQTVHKTPEGRFGVRQDKQGWTIANHTYSDIAEDEYEELEENIQKLKDVNTLLKTHGFPEESLPYDWSVETDPEELKSLDEEASIANEILSQYGLPPAKIKKEEDRFGSVQYVSDVDLDSLQQAHEDSQRANRILSQYPHLTQAAPMRSDPDGTEYVSNVDPDELESVHEEVQDANKVLVKHPNLPQATLLEESDRDGMISHSTVMDADTLKEKDQDLKRINKILGLYGIPAVPLVEEDGEYYPGVADLDADGIEEYHKDVQKINKKLASFGLEPNVKLKLADNPGGLPDLEYSHDLEEIEGALDVLKAFRSKKRPAVEEDEPEKYSRSYGVSDLFKANLVLRPFREKPVPSLRKPIYALFQSRLQSNGFPTRYSAESFNPNEARDKIGRWTVSGADLISPTGNKQLTHASEASAKLDAATRNEYMDRQIQSRHTHWKTQEGAQGLADRYNAMATLHKSPLAEVIENEHGFSVAHPELGEDEPFSESLFKEYQAVHEAVDYYNRLIAEYGDPESHQYDHETVPWYGDDWSDEPGVSTIEDAVDSVKQSREILAQHGPQKAQPGIYLDADGDYCPMVDDEDVTEMDAVAKKLNQKLAKAGLSPSFKLIYNPKDLEVEYSHDPDEIEEALDAMSKLKDFLPKKEKYSREFACLEDFRRNSVIQSPTIHDYFHRSLEGRELYGKKKSAAVGQRSLFDDDGDVIVTKKMVTETKPVVEEQRVSVRTVKKGHAKIEVQHRVLKPTERWITLHSHGGGGSRVIVNSDGEITGGHTSLVGKKLSDLFKKKPVEVPVEKIEVVTKVERKVTARKDDSGMRPDERRQRWIDVGKSEDDASWMAKMSWQFLTPEEKELFKQPREVNHDELLEENREPDEGHAESGVGGTLADEHADVPVRKTRRTRKKRGSGGVPDGASPDGAGGLADDVAGGDGPADGPGIGDAGSVAAGGDGSGPSGAVGDRGGDSGHGSSDGESFAQSVAEEPEPENPTDASAGNWRYQTRDFFQGGIKTKFRKNLEAIRTLREMSEEGRDVATTEEQEKMAQFVGWGAMPGLFNEMWDKETRDSGVSWEDWHNEKDKWGEEREELKKLLSDDEWDAARKATLNSHFTHPDVVDAHWKMAQKLGFKGGRFLEPSAGIGYYLGMMPPELAFNTHTSAVELDDTTGDLLKKLYPGSHVEVNGFQDHQAPKGFYDLVASNVPFGDYTVHDREYNKHKAQIHDYFFLKSADMTAPGGLVMHVTSTGTMDKPGDAIRAELAKTCDLVSAIRFPGGQHKENAGTEVVTDMLILRKRYPGEKAEDLSVTPESATPNEMGFTGTTADSLGRVYHWVDGQRVPGPQWMGTKDVPDPAGGDPILVNEYFADHPEQILGTLDRTGTMYRGESVNVSKTDDFEARLQSAIDRLPDGVCTSRDNPQKIKQIEQIATTGDVKDGGYVIRDGKLYNRVGGGEILQTSNGPMLARIGGQLAIRDAKQDVIEAELAGEDSTEERAELNRLYDAYVAKHGPLSTKENRNAMKGDPDAPNLLALEKYDSTTKKARKADMFSKETIRARQLADHAENVSEGVGVCLNEFGTIDPSRIAELTGKSKLSVEKELIASGMAFQDPQKGWIPADQYLSGNVRQKLVMARASAAVDPIYQPNVDALEKVQPDDIDYQDIDVRLGAAWVPPSDVQAFAANLVGVYDRDLTVKYIPETGEWQFDWLRKRGGAQVAQHQTGRKGFDDIMEAILNNKSLSVYDTEDDGSRTFNEVETLAVQEKANEIKEKFREWVWEDDDRRDRLHRFYNDNFNNIRPIQFNGSHLTFPGMNPEFQMRDIQKNFVWQAICAGRGLVAHEVGLGKTASLVASAMELRRLGLAKKPCLAVLKANVEQITKEALELYPGAKILSTDGKFDAQNRKNTIAQIATGDYDLIIMTHDHLDLLPMKPEVEMRFIEQELDELEEAKSAAWRDDPSKTNRIVKSIEIAKSKLEAKLKEAIDRESKDDAVSFEECGIDQLLIDEFHKFKNLPVVSRGERIKGVPQGRSDRATNMLMRTRWLMERNGNRGVIAATGTPVGNTMAELFNMQRYLQPDELKSRGISTFDAWASAFGDRTTSMEATVTGDYQPVTRFNRFTNIPELMNIAGQVMDVQRADNLKKEDGSPVIVRPKRHDQIVATPVNDGTKAMMADLHARALKCKGQRPEKGADNMAVICSDGRKGSLDLRMLYADAEDHPQSKVNQCVDQVLKIHGKRPEVTQLIFSNVGVNPSPETGFHLYADVIDKLVAGGIPRDKIADFSKLEGVKREAAQEAMKRGDIVVAIGSTEKLGTGVNVQNRVAALHHLDVPWMPSEIEQRDGRGYRSGNRNDPTRPANQQNLDIYRYVSEGSLDTFMWQIVGNKAHFINQIINGKNKNLRSVTDEDTETLSPEQLMAVASGDPRILQKVQLESDLRELRMSHDRHQRDQSKLRDQAKHYETHVLPNMEKMVKDYSHDAEHLSKLFKEAEVHKEKPFEMKIGGQSYSDRKVASEEFERRFKELSDEPYYRRSDMNNQIGEYRGFKIHAPHGYQYMGPEIQIEGPSGTKYTARASLPSIEAVMRGIPKIHENETKNLSAYQKDLETVKSNIGKEFRRAAELATKQKELQELDKELKAGNHKEPITPAPDELVDAEEPAQYSMAANVETMILRFRANATERLTARYSRESVRTSPESRRSMLVESFERYAKRTIAKSQSSLDFESLHPRKEDGEFVDKGERPSGSYDDDEDDVQKFIHFSENPELFDDGLASMDSDRPDDFKSEGLFVHRYHDEFPVQKLIDGWGGRTPIIIELPRKHANLIQTDPLGRNKDRDEYMIPRSAFQHAEDVYELRQWKNDMETYAKRNASVGQKSMFDEELHPRAVNGEFAEKWGRESVSSHGTDPLSLTSENVQAALEANTDDIIRRNPSLSPNMCKSLAAARILNAVTKEAGAYREAIDARVKRGEPVSDEEDDKYMDVADLRKRLFDPLVKLSGYRPGSEDELHEEALKPLVQAEEPKREMPDRIQSADAATKAKQGGLFSREDLTGQKQLFDTGNLQFEPKKSKGKSLFDTGPSTLEKIDDELKAKSIAPLAPQKDLFSRIESAKICHEETLEFIQSRK